MSVPPLQRRVVLVDDDDNVLGEDSVLETHLGAGKRHRAFTAIVLDEQGRVIVAERAPDKLLWPGHWDATVASHPRPGEGYEDAGRRRLDEELGTSCPLVWCGRFAYDLPYGAVGSENEVCATLVGRLAPGARIAVDPAEVSALETPSVAELVERLEREPARYCPWLFPALLLVIAHADQLGDLAEPLAPLLRAGVEARLRAALEVHFRTGGWTLVDRRPA